MKPSKNQIEKEKFIAIMKAKDPEAYKVALENGWLDRILKELGFDHKK